jgi:transcriptional regulator with XRE-family HTH domain
MIDFYQFLRPCIIQADSQEANMGDVSRLGRRVKRLRERAGMTQHELADRSGVSRTTIANLETGVRPSLLVDNAVRLADALGVSLDLLVRGDILDNDLAATLA